MRFMLSVAAILIPLGLLATAGIWKGVSSGFFAQLFTWQYLLMSASVALGIVAGLLAVGILIVLLIVAVVIASRP